MPNFTQLYKSTDLNAPPLSGQAGSLVVLLNAVLKDGYGFTGMAVTSITRAAAVATATVSAADGLKLRTGMLIVISGATGGDAALYNGTFTITVASTTTFTYTMTGTPAASPATGTTLASALLPVTGITRVSSTATVTLTNADGTLATGQWVKITGSGGGDYDGTFQITVTDGTHFTFTCVGTPTTPATGTIVYAKAGLGWTSPYTGTNAAVYYNVQSANPRYLQVIDNIATAGLGKEAQAMGFETMTAYNTGTNQWPTVAQAANGLCWRKSFSADAVVRAWTIAGDGKTFYLFMSDNATQLTTNSFGFGDFVSYKSGDVYNSFISGTTTFNTASTAYGLMIGNTLATQTATNGFFVVRGYTQLGTALNTTLINPSGAAANLGAGGGLNYPNIVDSGFYVGPVMLAETGSVAVRGRMRGMFAALHSAPLSNYDLVTGVVGLSGVTLTCVLGQSSNSPAQVLFDTYGTW